MEAEEAEDDGVVCTGGPQEHRAFWGWPSLGGTLRIPHLLGLRHRQVGHHQGLWEDPALTRPGIRGLWQSGPGIPILWLGVLSHLCCFPRWSLQEVPGRPQDHTSRVLIRPCLLDGSSALSSLLHLGCEFLGAGGEQMSSPSPQQLCGIEQVT